MSFQKSTSSWQILQFFFSKKVPIFYFYVKLPDFYKLASNSPKKKKKKTGRLNRTHLWARSAFWDASSHILFYIVSIFLSLCHFAFYWLCSHSNTLSPTSPTVIVFYKQTASPQKCGKCRLLIYQLTSEIDQGKNALYPEICSNIIRSELHTNVYSSFTHNWPLIESNRDILQQVNKSNRGTSRQWNTIQCFKKELYY